MDRAFSFIELLIAMACLSLLMASAIPAWQQHRAGHQLHQAAETLAQDLRNARSHSLIHNAPYYIHYDTTNNHSGINSDEDWCYILSSQSDCHCFAPGPACLMTTSNDIVRVSSNDFDGIHLVEARFGKQNFTRFEPVRGTAFFGRLRLEDDHQRSLKIILSLLGRIRICYPEDSIATGPYPAC